MTRDEYIASHRPSVLDEAVEEDALKRASPQLITALIEQQLNFNRLVYVRMAYLHGIFTDSLRCTDA